MSWSTNRLVLALAAVALSSWACNGDDDDPLPAIETLFPANNAVGAFVEDTAIGAAGVETATDDAGVVALINGGAGPFLQRDYDAFAIEHYTDSTFDLELRVWQLASSAVATDLYTGLLTESSTHQASTWTDASLGDAGRIADTGATFWFNVRKGPYLLEQTIAYDSGAVVDDPCKTAGQTFINAVLAKIP